MQNVAKYWGAKEQEHPLSILPLSEETNLAAVIESMNSRFGENCDKSIPIQRHASLPQFFQRSRSDLL